MSREKNHLKTTILRIILQQNQFIFYLRTRNRDKLGLVLNPRDGLEERVYTFSLFVL